MSDQTTARRWTQVEIVDRLDRFMRTWISNPLGQADFVRLIESVHQQPSHDHADRPLLDWIDQQRTALQGIKMWSPK